ncbi:MAG: hypothetical protein II996_07775 [Oscillospiraceae bacterium]|nr:hypothetical protein [Oscillospiraceae bacterium]MBQ4545448.1 hypothetical protein [Oscillospiraceae bacterium]
MTKKITVALLLFLFIFSLSACSWTAEPEALSGVAPATVDVQPTPVTADSGFMYDGKLSLADSFNQMNSLRLSICDDMYSAVVGLSDDSAWVPIAANKYSLGSDEFLAASYVMEIEPGITARKLFRENGFENVEISPLDVENTWKITATKDEDGLTNNYEYTVMYGAESDSYRFTLSINTEPQLMLASRRITGGYALQLWTPEGEYHILAQDVREGRFGFIPKQRDAEIEMPENDIYFDDSLITSSFTTEGAEYTFLLANNILYITKDGNNYAVPLH